MGTYSRGYYKCFYPYTGRISEVSKPLEYWIQMPNPDDTSGLEEYPILILQAGGGAGMYYQDLGFSTPSSSAPVNQTAFSEEDVPPALYTSADYPCISILPKIYDYSEWIDFPYKYLELNDFYNGLNNYPGNGVGFRILHLLLDEILAGTVVFYDTEECTTSWSAGALSLSPPDGDRIYYSGYSLGGIKIFDAAWYLRDLLAGAVVTGFGVKQGDIAYSKDVYRESSPYYVKKNADMLLNSIRDIAHIPIVFATGEWDFVSGRGVGFVDSNSDASYYSLLQAVADLAPTVPEWYFPLLTNALHSSFTQAEKDTALWGVGKEFPIIGNLCYFESALYRAKVSHTAAEANSPSSVDKDVYWDGPLVEGSWGGWTNTANTFDVTDFGEQFFAAAGENRKSARAWLWEQTKPATPETFLSSEITLNGKKIYRNFGLDYKDYGGILYGQSTFEFASLSNNIFIGDGQIVQKYEDIPLAFKNVNNVIEVHAGATGDDGLIDSVASGEKQISYSGQKHRVIIRKEIGSGLYCHIESPQRFFL